MYARVHTCVRACLLGVMKTQVLTAWSQVRTTGELEYLEPRKCPNEAEGRVGSWHLVRLPQPQPLLISLPHLDDCALSHLSLAFLLLHPACFLIIFKDGHPALCMK